MELNSEINCAWHELLNGNFQIEQFILIMELLIQSGELMSYTICFRESF